MAQSAAGQVKKDGVEVATEEQEIVNKSEPGTGQQDWKEAEPAESTMA